MTSSRLAARICSAGSVPRISAFYGLVIAMYWDDHAPPHFHASYAGETAQILIHDGAPLAGSLPPRALRLVREWSTMHREELRDPPTGP